jgi:hypothetical protein
MSKPESRRKFPFKRFSRTEKEENLSLLELRRNYFSHFCFLHQSLVSFFIQPSEKLCFLGA